MKIGAKALLGIPTTSNARRSLMWMDGVWNLQMGLCSSMGRYYVIDEPIAEARNAICRKALAEGVEYVFMLADDVIPPSNTILQMLNSLGRKFPSTKNSNVMVKADMITGIYWTRSYPSEPYIYRGIMQGAYTDWTVGEFFQVDYAGCDCLIIPTDVLRAIPEPWFSTEYVFKEGDPMSPINTEDIYFFTKAREYGFNLFADTSIQCLHEERTMGVLFGLHQGMRQMGGTYELTNNGDSPILVADIGAGKFSPTVLNGTFVRFDSREDSKPDVRCDIRNIPSIYQGKFDVVYVSHVLEHFAHDEIISCVKHWASLAKDGGEIVIKVPNIHHAMKEIVKSLDTIGQPNHKMLNPYHMRQIWGSQEPYENAYHRWGFAMPQLENVIKAIPGLEIVETKFTEDNHNLNLRAKVHHIPPVVINDVWDKIEVREANNLPVEKPVETAYVAPQLVTGNLFQDLQGDEMVKV